MSIQQHMQTLIISQMYGNNSLIGAKYLHMITPPQSKYDISGMTTTSLADARTHDWSSQIKLTSVQWA